ncbi:hypothetical protein ACTFQF_05540 [Aliivibrio fischeri]|uniref:hypothetical protein n=1 Tax=Aliivibrio fischeri TaxID=668 RepID=UPI0007C55575|nr:hypothetical protein [Aliivibrio fischeri]MBP3140690.1 hypothetical protein [Aliivibrio fischeri]MBP3156003.1 hypothetical protein [Aliivibrio fischeri]MCE7574468.1 hypothetical protein [Aliivibrio fischeri]
METKNLIPDPVKHLMKIHELLDNQEPFTFVRFSDGETEILKNRYLEISNGITIFRGQHFTNKYPEFDSKKFDPQSHQNIRKDLLESAMFKDMRFYKGIPTSHNDAINDRELMLRLNGGYDENITFADLLLNSNYKKYRCELIPLFSKYTNIYVIANHRAQLNGILSEAQHISVPDNFFGTYESCLERIMGVLQNVEKGALILSSASSLTKIIGHKLFLNRKDITFIDVGTSINDLLTLQNNIRDYLKDDRSLIEKLLLRTRKRFEIKW